MTTTPTTWLRGHRARLAVTVVAVLLGLLGMHALSTHGLGAASEVTASPRSTSSTVQPDSASPGHPAGHPAAHADGLTAPVQLATGHDDHQGHGGHDGTAMLMMCLAVLAAALSLLWPGLVRRLGFLRLPRLGAASLSLGRSLRLDTGPPPAWQFSVIRC